MEDKLLMAFIGNPFNFGIKVAKDTIFFLSSTYFIHILGYKKYRSTCSHNIEKKHVKFNVS